MRGTKAKIQVDPSTRPRFYRPRSVPFALREGVEKALERLEKEGIIEPVEFSDWAALIVPVVKKDGTIRVCGDYKLTVNQAAKVDCYPLPVLRTSLPCWQVGRLSQSWIWPTHMSSWYWRSRRSRTSLSTRAKTNILNPNESNIF